MEIAYPKGMTSQAFKDAKRDFEQEYYRCGLTEGEYKQTLKEIEEADEERRRRYDPDDNSYEVWMQGLIKIKEEKDRESRITPPDTLWTFLTPFNGACCLSLSIISNAIDEYIRFHPENPTMQRCKKEMDDKGHTKNQYLDDVHTFESAEYWLFGESDSCLVGYVRDTKYQIEKIKENVLKRLNAMRKSGWEGYSKRGTYTDKAREEKNGL